MSGVNVNSFAHYNMKRHNVCKGIEIEKMKIDCSYRTCREDNLKFPFGYNIEKLMIALYCI